jgi:hypothetical protein
VAAAVLDRAGVQPAGGPRRVSESVGTGALGRVAQAPAPLAPPLPHCLHCLRPPPPPSLLSHAARVRDRNADKRRIFPGREKDLVARSCLGGTDQGSMVCGACCERRPSVAARGHRAPAVHPAQTSLSISFGRVVVAMAEAPALFPGARGGVGFFRSSDPSLGCPMSCLWRLPHHPLRCDVTAIVPCIPCVQVVLSVAICTKSGKGTCWLWHPWCGVTRGGAAGEWGRCFWRAVGGASPGCARAACVSLPGCGGLSITLCCVMHCTALLGCAALVARQFVEMSRIRIEVRCFALRL